MTFRQAHNQGIISQLTQAWNDKSVNRLEFEILKRELLPDGKLSLNEEQQALIALLFGEKEVITFVRMFGYYTEGTLGKTNISVKKSSCSM